MRHILDEDFQLISKDLSEIPNFLNGNKILITGATGFLGGYLCKYLIYLKKSNNLDLSIYCTYRSDDRLKKKFSSDELKEIIPIKSNLDSTIDPIPVNYIFHAASIATPKLFKRFPLEVIAPNIFGLQNILRSFKLKDLKNILFFSTTGVSGFIDDNLRPNPENIYGPLSCNDIANCYLESKRMGEMLCMAWFYQKHAPVTIIRPAITYGPGIELDDGRSYADIVSCLSSNKDIELYSDGSAVRNFLYVSDFIRGLFMVLIHGKVGDTYNIANPEEISILNLAKLLTENTFKEKKLSIVFKQNPNNDFLRVEFNRTTVAIDKLIALGWKPLVGLEDGFKRTVEYYE